MAPLLLAIATELSREGKHLGGRGARAAIAKGPHLLWLTRSITARERDRKGHSYTFDLLWELYEDEKKEAEASGAAEKGSLPALAAAGGRAVKRVAWAASVTTDGAEDGVGSPQDDVSAQDGNREEAFGISTGDESGVVGETGAASVVAPPVDEKRHPRPPSSGRPKSVDPADEGGQRGVLRTLVGRRRESGGGMTRTCWGGSEEQQGCEGRAQASGEDREEEYVEAGEVEEGEEEEQGREVMGAEIEEEASSSVCGSKGASETRTNRERRNHGASSRKSKKDSGEERGGRSTRWKWKKDLCNLLKLMGGLDKVKKPAAGQPRDAVVEMRRAPYQTFRHTHHRVEGPPVVTWEMAFRLC